MSEEADDVIASRPNVDWNEVYLMLMINKEAHNLGLSTIMKEAGDRLRTIDDSLKPEPTEAEKHVPESVETNPVTPREEEPVEEEVDE